MLLLKADSFNIANKSNDWSIVKSTKRLQLILLLKNRTYNILEFKIIFNKAINWLKRDYNSLDSKRTNK